MTMLSPMSVTLPGETPDSDYVAAILAAAQARGSGELAHALSGARAQLAGLVNALFWASITTEEGRPIRGIVSLCPPDHPDSSSFEEPVGVSRESLVRLLTALPVTALAVYPSGSGCRIWGYLHQWPFFEPTVRIVGPGTYSSVMWSASEFSSVTSSALSFGYQHCWIGRSVTLHPP